MPSETMQREPSPKSTYHFFRKRLANLLEVAAFLSIAAMLIGCFGRWHFLPDLFSHFRIQSAAALFLAAIGLFFLKRRRWSLVSGVACVVLLATLVRFFLPVAHSGEADFRLMVMNVLTDNDRKEAVAGYIKKTNPDFIVLVETDAAWVAAMDGALLSRWPHRKAEPRSDNFGLVMYSKLPWESCEVIQYPGPMRTPALSATFSLPDGERLRLIGAHPVPPMNDLLWRSRNALFEQLAADVTAAGAARTIAVGDLNCTPWSYWFKRLQTKSGL